jgi:hypothetical protein
MSATFFAEKPWFPLKQGSKRKLPSKRMLPYLYG